MTTLTKQTTVGQFLEMQPNEFRSQTEQLWGSVSEIVLAVSEQVEAERLTPYQGASIAACVAATVFGYEELHARTTQQERYISPK